MAIITMGNFREFQSQFSNESLSSLITGEMSFGFTMCPAIVSTSSRKKSQPQMAVRSFSNVAANVVTSDVTSARFPMSSLSYPHTPTADLGVHSLRTHVKVGISGWHPSGPPRPYICRRCRL